MATAVENTPIGKVGYSREFLLTFANFRSTKPVPDYIYKYIESNAEPYQKMGTGRRSTKIKKKQKLFTIAIHFIVKCQIIQPNGKNTNFGELKAMCDNSHDVKNSSQLLQTQTRLTDKISDNCVSFSGFGTPSGSDRNSNK